MTQLVLGQVTDPDAWVEYFKEQGEMNSWRECCEVMGKGMERKAASLHPDLVLLLAAISSTSPSVDITSLNFQFR